MYDPEKAMVIRNALNTHRESVCRLRELSPDSPLTIYAEAVDECLYAVAQMYDDIVNCFDEEKKDRMIIKVRSVMSILSSQLEEVKNITERMHVASKRS